MTKQFILKENLFCEPDSDALAVLNSFDRFVSRARPLNAKQLADLPKNVRSLSHQLTDERSSRRMSYMNEAALLSAYAYYFLPWNLFRLTRILSGFPFDFFAHLYDKKDESVLLDIGAGPLTFAIALFLSRPELRTKKLTLYCVDISSSALNLGEELFFAVCAHLNCEPWKIIKVKGTLGVPIKQKCDFVSCVNMCNELYLEERIPLSVFAQKTSDALLQYSCEKSIFFIAEPGIPRSAEFVALLRNEFLQRKIPVVSPCPHSKMCPMNGSRGKKWCHFTAETKTAPKNLLKLSDAAHLPKERASLSFVCASTAHAATLEQNSTSIQTKKTPQTDLQIRVVSDPIKLVESNASQVSNQKLGRYACSKFGLTLITGKVLQYQSGTLLKIKTQNESHLNQASLLKDKKTGAVIINV